MSVTVRLFAFKTPATHLNTAFKFEYMKRLRGQYTHTFKNSNVKYTRLPSTKLDYPCLSNFFSPFQIATTKPHPNVIPNPLFSFCLRMHESRESIDRLFKTESARRELKEVEYCSRVPAEDRLRENSGIKGPEERKTRRISGLH